MKNNLIISDLDGCLCKSPKFTGNDEEWIKTTANSPVNVQVLHSAAALIKKYKADILFLSYRPGTKNTKQITDDWIHKNISLLRSYSEHVGSNGFVCLRKPDDTSSAAKFKEKVLLEQLKIYNVVAAFDDHPEICDMYRKHNIFTFQVMQNNSDWVY